MRKILSVLIATVVLLCGGTTTAANAAGGTSDARIRIGALQCHGEDCFVTLHFSTPVDGYAFVNTTHGFFHRIKVHRGRSTRVVAFPRAVFVKYGVSVQLGRAFAARHPRIHDLPVNSDESPCAALDATDAYLSVGPTSAYDASTSLPSVGTLHAAVIFADFPDLPGTGDPVATHSTWLADGIRYSRKSSYGKLDVSLAAVTPGWVRLPRTTTSYGITDGYTYDEHRAYVQDAISAVDSSVDFSDVDVVMVLVPPGDALPRSATFRGAPGSLSTTEGPLHAAITFGSDATTIDGVTFSHELAHVLGLPDLYAIPGPDYHRYVGMWDYMGSIFTPQTDLMAWQRLKLGWLPSQRMLCAGDSGTTAVRLAPLERAGRAPTALFVRTGPTTGIVVENRQPLHADASLCESGALVYTLDSSIATGDGPIRVQGGTRDGCGAGDRSDAPLGVGQHLRVDGVRISVVGAAGHAVEVRVRR